MHITFAQAATACNGTYYGSQNPEEGYFTSVTTDSRKAAPGVLFFAIKGERVDGHDFMEQVYDKGAAICIGEKEPIGDKPYIQVDSTLQALKDLAEYYRSTLTIPIIGIVGSVGKTSTKEMTASILAQKYHVLKTEGNYNNEIGLPLTIFSIQDHHEAAVVEMGISDFGEMTRLSKVAKPDTIIMTNIGQCHLENLGDRDGVLKAKSEVFTYWSKQGVIILNGDDDILRTLESKLPVQFFGLNGECEAYAEDSKDLGMEGTFCTLVFADGMRIPVSIPIPGQHMVYNALAGALAGRAYGLTAEEIAKGVAALQPVAGRNNRIQTERFTILDDCYNANPMSMCASLDVLAKSTGRKVAILGDMYELGEEENVLHAKVGSYVAKAGIDVLLCSGGLSAHMAEAAQADGMQYVYYFQTREELQEALPQYIQTGDSILVKASHGMQYTAIVEALQKL